MLINLPPDLRIPPPAELEELAKEFPQDLAPPIRIDPPVWDETQLVLRVFLGLSSKVDHPSPQKSYPIVRTFYRGFDDVGRILGISGLPVGFEL